MNRAQQGGGSEANLARPTLAGPSHLLRHTARQRCAAVQMRVAYPQDVSCSCQFRPGHGGRVSPTDHARVPGFPAGGRCRRSAACSGPSGCPPDGITGVVCSTPAALLAEGDLPCGRRRRSALSGRQAGSEAQVRPHRPRPAPAVLPMQPVATAPRGQPLASANACPTRFVVAPVSSLLLLQRLREPPVRMVEHPTGPFASDSQRSSLRGVVRPHAGPRPCAGRHPRAADYREDQPNPARYRTWGLDLDDACSRRPRGRRSTDIVPLPFARRCRRSAPGTGCPMAVGGRGAPGPLPAPSEGVATLAGRDQGKWSSARARVAGSGRRRGRHGLGRPSPRGLACVAGRCARASPLAGTRWAGAEVRRPTRCGGCRRE